MLIDCCMQVKSVSLFLVLGVAEGKVAFRPQGAHTTAA